MNAETTTWVEQLPDGTPVKLSVQRIPAGDLVKPEYQRDPVDRVLRLKRNLSEAGGFDPVLAGVQLAFYRDDGKHALADGLGTQWMAHAAKGPGHPLTVLLVSADPEGELGVVREQGYFRMLNRMRLRLSPADEFQSLLSVGDEHTLEIRDLFMEFGITLTTRTSLKDGLWGNLSWVNEVDNIAINNIAEIKNITQVRKYGATPQKAEPVKSALSGMELMRESLQLQEDSWGMSELDGQMLTGTARLLAHPWNALHCDRKILTEVLNKYPGPAVLKLVAKDVRNGNGAGIRIARFLIREYNSEMRGTGQKRLKYV